MGSSKPSNPLDKVGSFEITSYEYNGKDIIITKIKALDNEGVYMKFVKLESVLPYLSQKPIRFKTKIEDNPHVKELMERFGATPVIKKQ
jgi:helix-turn-helix protein